MSGGGAHGAEGTGQHHGQHSNLVLLTAAPWQVVCLGGLWMFVFIEARQHGVCDVGSVCISLAMHLARQGAAAGQSPNAAHT